MSEHPQPGSTGPQGGYERSDITARFVLYFMGGLALATVLVVLFLDGLYGFLNKSENTLQPALSPLVTNAPQDTRTMPGKPKDYLEKAFPNPRLETDERGQLRDIITPQDETLGSYGYVDEKSGTVRIPIERAMELTVQRGLGTRPIGKIVPLTKEKGKK